MLNGSKLDEIESKALSWAAQKIDIYSCSWGPRDDGKQVEGPEYAAHRSLQNGTLKVSLRTLFSTAFEC